MIKYISKRILYMLFVFAIMSLILFLIFSMVPGDPAATEMEPLREQLTAEEFEIRYQMIRQQMGLDDPLYIRYLKWAGNLLRGDLGMSSKFKAPVTEVIKAPLKVTLLMNILSLFLTFLITIPLGIYTAVKKNSIFDKFTQVVTVVGYSVPSYIFGLIFIYIFAVKLNLLPVSGLKTANFSGTAVEAALDMAKHLALPLMVMVFSSLSGLTRYIRAAMGDALTMDYIKTARAKGLKEKVVILSHAWRNALLPVITLLISWITSIFGGSIIIENLFNLGGLGKLFYDALLNQDYNLALAGNMFYIFIALVGNLITDLSYGMVDPRVRVNK